jgi:hypothetical protein
MVARAHIAHRMKGRARLRIPSERGNHAYFTEVERALKACPSVEWAGASFITGGLLVCHKGELEGAIAPVIERGLLHLGSEETKNEPGAPAGAASADSTLHAICDGIACLNQDIVKGSNGVSGLSTMVFFGLVGAAVYQVIGGRILPPAFTLVVASTTLLSRTFESKRRRKEGGGSAA